MGRHEGWEPEAGGGHRWIKAWGWDGGWPLAWPTDDSMHNSSDNRRSRTTASSRAMVRWRARTRALRARIRQSPLLFFGVLGVPGGDYLDDGQDSPLAVGEVRIFNTPDISGQIRTFRPSFGLGTGVMVERCSADWEPASVSRGAGEWFQRREPRERKAFSSRETETTRSNRILDQDPFSA